MVRHFRYRDFQLRAVNTVIALRDDDQRCAREIDRCSNYLTNCPATSQAGYPNHSGCCAVPSNIAVVLNGSYVPVNAASFVLATSALS